MNKLNKKKKIQTSDIILDHAKREFSKYGYYQTSVEQIAHSAKVGKGTVYRHFGSKDNLFSSVLQSIWSDDFEKLTFFEYTGDFQNDLINLLEKVINVVYERRNIFRTMFHFYSKSISSNFNSNVDGDTVFKQFGPVRELVEQHKNYMAHTKRFLKNSIEKGYKIEDSNIELLANIIWKFLGGLFRDLLVMDTPVEEVRRDCRYFSQLISNGLRNTD